MSKEAIFDKQGFMSYMEEHFPAPFYGLAGGFLRETVANIIAYGLKHHTHGKDELVYFLKDILPEVEFEEIAVFANESILTQSTKAAIRKWTEKNG